MSGLPWGKFYWSEWQGDSQLRLCSLGGRGLWMELLCIAARSQRYGFVLVGGRQPSIADLARVASATPEEVETYLDELDSNGVLSRDRAGRIYSRRMIREHKNHAASSKGGKKGGRSTFEKKKGIFGTQGVTQDSTLDQIPEPDPEPEEECVHKAAAAPPGDGGTRMVEENFNLWIRAISATIPKGWSRPNALRAWLKLPLIDLDVITQAWRLYLDDCEEKSKKSKFPQRVMYPENWLRNRVYESFVDLANERVQLQRQRAELRDQTVRRWNGHAKAVIDAIGQAKFDSWLLGSSINAVNEHEFVITIPKAFLAKHVADDAPLLQLIGKALGGSVTVRHEAKAA